LGFLISIKRDAVSDIIGSAKTYKNTEGAKDFQKMRLLRFIFQSVSQSANSQ